MSDRNFVASILAFVGFVVIVLNFYLAVAHATLDFYGDLILIGGVIMVAAVLIQKRVE